MFLLVAGFTLLVLSVMFTRHVLPLVRERRLRAKSRGWPHIPARLDHACVTEYRPSDTLITYRLDAWFTYVVNGKDFEGSYSDDDMRLDDAKRLLRHLNHEPVLVAYNPSKPAEYFYQPPDGTATAG
ncbi:MAG: hypothetical protein WDO18_09260 [Acidobacteriota bacterium]